MKGKIFHEDYIGKCDTPHMLYYFHNLSIRLDHEYVIQKLGYDPGFAVIGFIGYALFKMVEICAKILIRAIRSIIKSEKK